MNFAVGVCRIGAMSTLNDWLAYLGRTEHGELAKRVWALAGDAILGETGLHLAIPSAMPIEDGGLHLSWDAGRYHVDIDILPDGKIDWFFRDRETNELDGTEDPVDADPLPRPLLTRLRHMASV